VPPIERAHDLARIEVGKRYDLDFREAELRFDPRRNSAHVRFVGAAAQDLCDLDFHLHAFHPHVQPGDTGFVAGRDCIDPRAGKATRSTR